MRPEQYRWVQVVMSAVCLGLYFYAGAWIHRHWLSTIPSAVLGVLLLFVSLLLIGTIPQWLENGVQVLLRHFTLFLLPPSVGVIALWPVILRHWAGFSVSLLLSVFIPLYFAAITYQWAQRHRI